MRITVINEAGFCFGVKRATQLAFKTAAHKTGRVFTLGSLIHNPQQVEKLEQAWVEVISCLEQVTDGTLIVRSHGLHPKILKQAKQQGLKIVDATCPFVKKVQRDAANLRKEGYQVVIIGDMDHPEVQSIKGSSGNDLVVLGDKTEIKQLTLSKKLGIVAQTTQSLENFSQIVAQLAKQASEIKIYNTICEATAIRQKATLQLARIVDAMVVVGGRNSANTNRLVKLCRKINKPTYLVETADEIDSKWIEGKKEIGVSAGASTPEWIISQVMQQLKAFN